VDQNPACKNKTEAGYFFFDSILRSEISVEECDGPLDFDIPLLHYLTEFSCCFSDCPKDTEDPILIFSLDPELHCEDSMDVDSTFICLEPNGILSFPDLLKVGIHQDGQELVVLDLDLSVSPIVSISADILLSLSGEIELEIMTNDLVPTILQQLKVRSAFIFFPLFCVSLFSFFV